jgi:hypothetical protein
MTLLSMFLRKRSPSRSWSQFLWEKTLRKQQQKLNNYRRTMATTRMTTTITMTIVRRKKKTMRLKKR